MNILLIGNSMEMDYPCWKIFWVGRFIIVVVARWKNFISLMGLELYDSSDKFFRLMVKFHFIFIIFK